MWLDQVSNPGATALRGPAAYNSAANEEIHLTESPVKVFSWRPKDNIQKELSFICR